MSIRVIPPGTWAPSLWVQRWARSCAAALVITIHRTHTTAITTRTLRLTAITPTTLIPAPTAMEARPTVLTVARTGELLTTQTPAHTPAEQQPPRRTGSKPLARLTTRTREPMGRPTRAQTLTDRGDSRPSARTAIRLTRNTPRTPTVQPERCRLRKAVRAR